MPIRPLQWVSLCFFVISIPLLSMVGSTQQHASAIQTGSEALHVWEPIAYPPGVTAVNRIAISPLDAQVAYIIAASSQNNWIYTLYKTMDAGKTWSILKDDFISAYGVVVAPSDEKRIYVITNDQVFRSSDGGATWTDSITPGHLHQLTVAPSDPDRIYGVNYSMDDVKFYRSDDGGATWYMPGSLPGQGISYITVSPIDSDIVLGISSNESGSKVLRSMNGGILWESVFDGSGGSLFYDPQSSHTVYFTVSEKLLRSDDDGLTWRVADIHAPIGRGESSPFGENTVLAGVNDVFWRIVSQGDTWAAYPWQVPLELMFLWRSYHDGSVLYATTPDGIWRCVSIPSEAIYLPFIQTAEGEMPNDQAQTAIARLNIYREIAGSPPLLRHPAIVDAAQNHADYHMLNYDDPSAWQNGPHGEVEGKPGYTGTWPLDRMWYAGYPDWPYWGGSEVMHYINNPIASVDDWMSTIYHRVLAIDPSMNYTGYGLGGNGQTSVDVMDFGSGPLDLNRGEWVSLETLTYPLGYPVDGQRDVPTSWGGGEIPDPLPPGASRPVGYPFTLQGVGGTLTVSAAEMRDANGTQVSVHPNPPDCFAFNCFGLIPVSPLIPGMTYRVSAQGMVGNTPFDRTWSFTTKISLNGEGSQGAKADHSDLLEEPFLVP